MWLNIRYASWGLTVKNVSIVAIATFLTIRRTKVYTSVFFRIITRLPLILHQQALVRDRTH